MRTRPLWVFVAIASLMVCWLSIRMWFGDRSTIWAASCLLGAWAPLATAVVYVYIREAGKQEHGVLAAWLVRAIGMHCVLVWLLGINDFLRGPPGLPPRWNTDLGMPVVLVAFAPVFALSVAIVRWVQHVSQRLDPPPVPTLHGSPMGAGVIPYRSHTVVATHTAPSRGPVVPWLAGVAASWMAATAPLPASWLVSASVLVLACITLSLRRAVVPGVVSVIAVTGVALTHETMRTATETVRVEVLWPLLSMVGIVAYSSLVDAGRRVREAIIPRPARQASPTR